MAAGRACPQAALPVEPGQGLAALLGMAYPRLEQALRRRTVCSRILNKAVLRGRQKIARRPIRRPVIALEDALWSNQADRR